MLQAFVVVITQDGGDERVTPGQINEAVHYGIDGPTIARTSVEEIKLYWDIEEGKTNAE